MKKMNSNNQNVEKDEKVEELEQEVKLQNEENQSDKLESDKPQDQKHQDGIADITEGSEMSAKLQQDNNEPKDEVKQMHSLILQDKGVLVSQTEIVTRSVIKNLIREATLGMKNAYAPYSNFHVGAALLTVNEHIYRGCNIENASYGTTNCAERTALYKAISEGEREFAAIAVVGGRNGVITDYCPPCGVCRQVMREFVHPKSFIVILARSEDDYLLYSLDALLPLSFGAESMT